MKQQPLFEDEKVSVAAEPAAAPARQKPVKNITEGRIVKMLEQHGDLFDVFDESDLPNDDMRLVAEVLGLEAAFLLIVELGGIQLSIPKSGLKSLAKKYIERNFDGANSKALAIKCRVSQAFVYSCSNKQSGKSDE